MHPCFCALKDHGTNGTYMEGSVQCKCDHGQGVVLPRRFTRIDVLWSTAHALQDLRTDIHIAVDYAFDAIKLLEDASEHPAAAHSKQEIIVLSRSQYGDIDNSYTKVRFASLGFVIGLGLGWWMWKREHPLSVAVLYILNQGSYSIHSSISN